MKVLTTRSHEGHAMLAEKLRARGFEPISLDILSFKPAPDGSGLDERLRGLTDYGWLVLTSATGVETLLGRLRQLGLPGAWAGPPKVAAVGEETARALRSAGARVDFVPSSFLTEALGRELPGRGRVLLLRGRAADGSLGRMLARRGFEVDEVHIYETEYLPIDDRGKVDAAEAVVFGSPTAVEGLCSQLTAEEMARLARKTAACVGPVTAAAARSAEAATLALLTPRKLISTCGNLVITAAGSASRCALTTSRRVGGRRRSFAPRRRKRINPVPVEIPIAIAIWTSMKAKSGRVSSGWKSMGPAIRMPAMIRSVPLRLIERVGMFITTLSEYGSLFSI